MQSVKRMVHRIDLHFFFSLLVLFVDTLSWMRCDFDRKLNLLVVVLFSHSRCGKFRERERGEKKEARLWCTPGSYFLTLTFAVGNVSDADQQGRSSELEAELRRRHFCISDKFASRIADCHGRCEYEPISRVLSRLCCAAPLRRRIWCGSVDIPFQPKVAVMFTSSIWRRPVSSCSSRIMGDVVRQLLGRHRRTWKVNCCLCNRLFSLLHKAPVDWHWN